MSLKTVDMEDLPLSDVDDDFSKETAVKRPRLLTQQERDRLEVAQYMAMQQQQQQQQKKKKRRESKSSQDAQSAQAAQVQLQLQLDRQQQELLAMRQELEARAQEAAAAKAALSSAQQQVAALKCIVEESKQVTLVDLVQQDVGRSYGAALPALRLLYHDVPDFVTLRQQAVYNRIELLATVSAAVARARLTELQTRELMDADIEMCLKIKKQTMEDRGAPPRRVQDGVLQLLRMLHRRQAAVLQGYKLAPAGSLFAQVPK